MRTIVILDDVEVTSINAPFSTATHCARLRQVCGSLQAQLDQVSLKGETLKWMVNKRKSYKQWMIEGYPYFSKPPYV
jgi:hypothetical protein